MEAGLADVGATVAVGLFRGSQPTSAASIAARKLHSRGILPRRIAADPARIRPQTSPPVIPVYRTDDNWQSARSIPVNFGTMDTAQFIAPIHHDMERSGRTGFMHDEESLGRALAWAGRPS